MTEHDAKMAAWSEIAELGHPRAGDLYRHYKGDLYMVLMTGIREDTLEPVVGYYGSVYNLRLVRTLANWTEEVETPAGRVPRFVLELADPLTAMLTREPEKD